MKASKQEIMACERRELTYIDPYPELEEFHQNDFLAYLDRMDTDYLVARKRVAKAVDTDGKAKAYAESVRESFRQSLGPLPEGEAARAEVTGTLDKGDYLIDKVLIESLPDQYASANFYYPKSAAGRLPAILFLCGHALEGKASPMYVSFCVEAVKNGFCVLAVDPVGQGDRKLAAEGSKQGWLDPVKAHCVIDRRLTLIGEHLAQYMMRDNVKALDYLLARSEVDPERVAATGNSGGGTMSAFMGAFDERIKAVAPCCYITELRALLHRIMAQDAEQCLPGFMQRGLDLSDLVTAAAPKPYMIGAALFDFFPIDGVRDAYIEAKGMYRLLGEADKLEIYTAMKGHGLWHDTREAVLRFFCRHFGVAFNDRKAIDYDDLPQESELSCLAGIAGVRLGQYTLEAYIQERAESLPDANREGGGKPQKHQIRKRVIRALGILPEAVSPAAEFESLDGNDGEFTFFSEKGMRVHASWKRLRNPSGPVLIAVGGIDADAERSKSGEFSAIVTVHPRGTGPDTVNARSGFGIFEPESANAYHARMLGTTLQGMRVTDALAAVRALRRVPGFEQTPISLYGKEEHALTALYTAIIEEVTELHLADLLSGFRQLLLENQHAWGPGVFIPGAIGNFEVEDLVSALREAGISVNVDRRLDHMKNEIRDLPEEREVIQA